MEVKVKMKKIGKTLYKMDSKGKIRSWEIFAGDNGICPAYSVLHGQLGGKVQATEVEVPNGKNLGRANATTAEAQCLSEAEALYQKQITRKGYTETIPTEVPDLPMLAHKYKDFAHKINWPASVSPKIDGCLSGDTLIQTKEFGIKAIKYIVENKLNCRVLSYNTKTKKAEKHPVLIS